MASDVRRVMTFNHAKLNFAVVGSLGAMHFWVDTPRNDLDDRCQESDCGIEIHSRKPLYGRQNAADNDRCWIVGGPCWHDGSTLVAREFWVPLFRTCNSSGNFDALFMCLESDYRDRLSDKEPR
jgi:hypothetical protein